MKIHLTKKILLSYLHNLLVAFFICLSLIVLTLIGQSTSKVAKRNVHVTVKLSHSTTSKKSTKPVNATPPTVIAKSVPAPVKAVAPTPVPSKVITQKPAPVVVPSPGSNVSSLTPSPSTPPANPNSGQGNSNPAPQTSYTSTNWSGYMSSNAVYTGVSASWTTPHVSGNGSTTSADASWIGIGGVTTNDLIQVGTDNIVSASGQVSTSAFYELLPDASINIPSMSVSQGDSMSATLNEISSGQWNIYIIDNTSGQSFTVSVPYASTHSSVEWIEEDPSYSRSTQIPFDTYGSVLFANGSTKANGSNTNISTSNTQEITMVNGSGNPISTPSAINGSSFSVTQN